MKIPLKTVPLLVAWLLCFVPEVLSQTRTQDIELVPGWNAVFLEVQPDPRDAELALAQVPVESVWLWNGRTASSQFVQDPGRLTPESPDWLVFLPARAGQPALGTLFTLPGGRPYLVKLGGSTPVVWRVSGRPANRAPVWKGERFNFVGFHLDPAVPVTIQDFFSPVSALHNQPVYTLSPAGEWQLVTDRTSRPLKPGRAYWVYAREATDFDGPLSAESVLQGDLAFGGLANRLKLRVGNLWSRNRSIRVRPVPTGPAPAGTPYSLGPVRLGVRQRNSKAFVPFETGVTLPLGPGQSDDLPLEIRRHEMIEASVPAGVLAASFQTLLEVTDGAGSRRFVSVTAASPNHPELVGVSPGSSAAQQRGRSAGTALDPVGSPYAGLWSGFVSVDQVSEPRHATAPGQPRPAAGTFQFRVLVHVDTAGTCRLLGQAYVMFKAGEFAAPTGNGPSEVAQPGRYVILTDESLLGLRDAKGALVYTGSMLRDDVRIGRRISCATLSLDAPLMLSGNFGPANSVLSGTNRIPFNHPLNPFVHRYHPDHDNKDREFVPYAGPNEESWDLVREMTFYFTGADPAAGNVPIAGFGAGVVGGRYEEMVVGIHKTPIRTAGTFRLTRILEVDQLNDRRP